jgi:hypothetical protein
MGKTTKLKERQVSEEPTPPASSDSEEEEFIVEKILDRRYVCCHFLNGQYGLTFMLLF